MRRQMQLRPSQGGKMRGPTNAERQRVLDGRVEQVKAALALLEPDGEPTHEGNSLYSRFRNDHTCRCGYVLCACAPTEPADSGRTPGGYCAGCGAWWCGRTGGVTTALGSGWAIEDGVHKSPKCRTPEPAEPEPRIEVGMRVRVRDDARDRRGNPSSWRGMTGRVLVITDSTVWLAPRIASHISNVEPIE